MKTKAFTKQVSLALMVAVGLWFPGFTIAAQAQEHPERAKFHADVAHALLEMNTTLDLIEAYRAQGAMPPDRDAKHEKAAHGFKHALELFGVKIAMPEHRDKNAFHADVAHALLDMNTTLDLIGAYRVEGAMPPDRDEKHEKAVHGFLKGLQLFAVQTSMPAAPSK